MSYDVNNSIARIFERFDFPVELRQEAETREKCMQKDGQQKVR
eukprot:COSAG02_NODE_3889_length_6077_cov_5.012953_1_plen_42_part_10